MRKLSGAITVIVLTLGALVFTFMVKPELDNRYRTVRTMLIKEADLTTIADGVYRGEFTYSNFTYKVEVTVKGQKIAEIKMLSNRDSDYARKAEGVIERVIEKQSLKVDAVSGATTTSKAILKAIEDAFRS